MFTFSYHIFYTDLRKTFPLIGRMNYELRSLMAGV